MEKSGREWLLYLASRPPVAPLAKTLQFSLAKGVVVENGNGGFAASDGSILRSMCWPEY
jgi:hypothetical protein